MRRIQYTTHSGGDGSAWSFSNACTSAKETMRSEINAQIEEFLRHGGQIRVVDTGASATATPGKVISNIGSVWHGQDALQAHID